MLPVMVGLVIRNSVEPSPQCNGRRGSWVGAELFGCNAEPSSEQNVLQQIGAVSRADTATGEYATDGVNMPEQVSDGGSGGGEG